MKALWITALSLAFATAVPGATLAQERVDDPGDEAAGAADETPAAEADEATPAEAEGDAETGSEGGDAEGETQSEADDGAQSEGDGEAQSEGEEQGEDGESEDEGEGEDREEGADEGEGEGEEGESSDESEAGTQEDFGEPIVAEGGTFWMPKQASSVSQSVDWLYYAITGLSIFCFVGIAIVLLYFCIRFRARDGRRAEPSPDHNDAIEITWTVIPSIIVVIVFVLGWQGYMKLAAEPQHAEEIDVTARKWTWEFTYPNGWVDSRLHVPVNEPVKLVMRSDDVIHSLFVPAFRVKMDVPPGRYTHMWFEADEPGTYRLYCTEYCGEQHADMKTEVVVHPPGGYESYLEEAQQEMMDLPPVELGELLYEMRGCDQCHSTDGTRGEGPSFKGIWGEEHELEDGSTVTVDENYIRTSLLDPQGEVRAGFNPVMPTFRGRLKDNEIDAIVEFIKSLE